MAPLTTPPPIGRRQEEFCLRSDRKPDQVPEREALRGGGPSDAAAFGTSHSCPRPIHLQQPSKATLGVFLPVYGTSSLRAGKLGLGCDPAVGATSWFGV